jgi:DNA-binding response OmpR family regulator
VARAGYQVGNSIGADVRPPRHGDERDSRISNVRRRPAAHIGILAGSTFPLTYGRITFSSSSHDLPLDGDVASRMRALLIEDDQHLAKALVESLVAEGFRVDHATTAEEGRTLALSSEYDAIITDLMLPDGNGTILIRQLRQAKRDAPIAVITGLGTETSTVVALDAGADDYINKPVGMEVFRARVRALVRRGGAKRTEQLVFGNVVLNRLTRQALVDTRPLALTPRDLALLEHFMMRAESVITRAELLQKVFGLKFAPGTNVLDVGISRLRRKLQNAGASVSIVGRRGIGFLLTAAPDAG